MDAAQINEALRIIDECINKTNKEPVKILVTKDFESRVKTALNNTLIQCAPKPTGWQASFMGIPFIVSDIMPEDVLAYFLDRDNKLVGVIKK